MELTKAKAAAKKHPETTAAPKAECNGCPNNTGSAPDLFDWDGKPKTLGKCMCAKCYEAKCKAYCESLMDEAKADGLEVKRLYASYAPYEARTQAKRDAHHNTLYVWEDYNGSVHAEWGERIEERESADGKSVEEAKEERRAKLAQGKARRKLADWCMQERGGLADVIAGSFPSIMPETARAFQDVFQIGNSRSLVGTNSDFAEIGLRQLLGKYDELADTRGWAAEVAAKIGRKIARAEVGTMYAGRLMAVFVLPDGVLTEEERRLVVSDEELDKLRNPAPIIWAADVKPDEIDEAEDAEAEEGSEADDE